jgi:hypothetical protein
MIILNFVYIYECMLKNVFLDKLRNIHFKEEINIIFITYPFYMIIKEHSTKNTKSSFHKNLFKILEIEKKRIKIHSIKYPDKTKIMKLIFHKDNEFIEYFICFKNYYNSLLETLRIGIHLYNSRNVDIFLTKNNIQENDIKNIFYFNKNENAKNNIFLKEHVMSISYEYRYIKGSKGQKELVPIETFIPNKLKPIIILNLLDEYCGNSIYYSRLEYYLDYRIKRKKTKYEKILEYIFKEDNDSYFNYLTDDLKREICLYF